MSGTDHLPAWTRATADALLADEQRRFDAARRRGDNDAAWDALKTIHIIAQPFLALHWVSHVAMLRYALDLGDWREAGGQLLRLLLVPLGNATGRLPAGNHGRARVSPFRPMPLPSALQDRLRTADSAVVDQ